jgi:hypothetical protein
VDVDNALAYILTLIDSNLENLLKDDIMKTMAS